VLKFTGSKRQTGEVPAPSRNGGGAKQEAKDTERDADGVSITRGPVDQTVFRLRFRALLRPRVRPSRTETLAWTRDRKWVAALGSFEDLEREVNRSRRFGHSFFVARIPPVRTSTDVDGWREQTLALLVSLIRNVDTVWSNGKDVYLLLPESDRESGTTALSRIREPLSNVLSEEELDKISFVVFAPDECPTSRALISALHGRVRDAKTQPRGACETAGTPVVDPEGVWGST
jgi:hypothetical protein